MARVQAHANTIDLQIQSIQMVVNMFQFLIKSYTKNTVKLCDICLYVFYMYLYKIND